MNYIFLNALLTPAFGTIVWQALILLLLLIVLRLFAWKPILTALNAREKSIDEALKMADTAKQEMENLKADNEKLLAEAKNERDKILKDASKIADDMKEKAKTDAIKIGEKMIDDAKASIENEKEEALKEIRNQVADLSLQISELLLRQNLQSDPKQQELISKYMKDLKLN